MTTVTRSDDPERKLSEALRARATGAGMPLAGPVPTAVPRAARRAAVAPQGMSARMSLALTLLGGLVLGAALALLSLWAPGLLPPLG
jgi:hypothetical protein